MNFIQYKEVLELQKPTEKTPELVFREVSDDDVFEILNDEDLDELTDDDMGVTEITSSSNNELEQSKNVEISTSLETTIPEIEVETSTETLNTDVTNTLEIQSQEIPVNNEQ